MKNFVQEGRALDFVATAVVASGLAVLINTILVIPATNAGIGQVFSGWIHGVYEIPCATGTAWKTCDTLYWDNTNKRVTTTATNNTKIGMAGADKVAGDATGWVKLLPAV